MKPDYYRILGLAPEASAEQIQRAYRSLALRYHPDRNPEPDAAVRMTYINEAYEVLGNSERRHEYDAQLTNGGSLGPSLAGPILAAARETVLRSGWTVLQDAYLSILLEKAGQRVRFVLIDRLNNAGLARICRQYTDRTVVLAVNIEMPINLGLQTTVIDLMHSKRHARPSAPNIEPGLQSLLAPFL